MYGWLRDWLMLSAFVFLLGGMLVVLWVIWPLVPARMSTGAVPVDVEGLGAVLFLIFIVVGYGKLLRGK